MIEPTLAEELEAWAARDAAIAEIEELFLRFCRSNGYPAQLAYLDRMINDLYGVRFGRESLTWELIRRLRPRLLEKIKG